MLFRVSYGFLVVGGPASTLLLLWLTLPSDKDTGANIGGGMAWFLAMAVLGLGLVLGLVATVVRLVECRSATRPATSHRSAGLVDHDPS